MESATKTSFAIVDMPLAAEPPDLKRYDEDHGMDPGGIVGEGGDGAGGVAKPKRTRAARAKGGAGSNVKTEGGAGSGGIYLVLNPDNTYREIKESDLEAEAVESLKDPGGRIVRAVVGAIAKPVVSFEK
jgi:hypothetical protein